jgi:hypothetical protein
VASIFCSRPNENGDYIDKFSNLPNLVRGQQEFNSIIKSKIGIIILYQGSELSTLETFMEQLRVMDYVLDIIVFII